MKKENYCVDVPDLKMAPIIRQTLEINGEKFNPYYRWDGNSVLLYSTCDSMWYWGAKLLGEKKQFVTFGQLIDLLNEPKKIAVRVDNEKEFKALMKHYDSLGWKSFGGLSVEELSPVWSKSNYPQLITCNNGFESYYRNPSQCKNDHEIIPFSKFAEQKGIKLPLLTSEDGVDLYDGDDYHEASWYEGGKVWQYVHGPSHKLKASHRVYEYREENKAFSTKQAALEWIEAQKPKSVIVGMNNHTQETEVFKDGKILIRYAGMEIPIHYYDLSRLQDAYKRLNS